METNEDVKTILNNLNSRLISLKNIKISNLHNNNQNSKNIIVDDSNKTEVAELNSLDEFFKNNDDNLSNFQSSFTGNFNKIPHYILENYISPYLTSKDLFYYIRPVCTEWSDSMKHTWCNKIKEELIDQVKSIDFVYEKEVISKTYEFKVEYLINYRNLLTMYHININLLEEIGNLFKSIVTNEIHNTGFIDYSTNLVEVKNNHKLLFKLYFKYFSLSTCIIDDRTIDFIDLIDNENYEDLVTYLNKPDITTKYKDCFSKLINVENQHNYFDNLEKINKFKEKFTNVNKTLIDETSEHSKLIYSLLQGMIEYEILKHDIEGLKNKQEELIKKIQYVTKYWPKRKLFFEKAYKLMLYTRNTNPQIKELAKICEKIGISHPLYEYNDEALKLVAELREELSKIQLKKDELKTADFSQFQNLMFNNIMQRRIVLTKKIVTFDAYNTIFRKMFVKVNHNNQSDNLNLSNDLINNADNLLFRLNNVDFTTRELLWTLKFASKLFNDKLTPQTLLSTKYYLDANFDYQKYTIKKEQNIRCISTSNYASNNVIDKDTSFTTKGNTNTIVCNSIQSNENNINYNIKDQINSNNFCISSSSTTNDYKIQHSVSLAVNEINIEDNNIMYNSCDAKNKDNINNYNSNNTTNTLLTEVTCYNTNSRINQSSNNIQNLYMNNEIIQTLNQVNKLTREKNKLEIKKKKAEFIMNYIKSFNLFKEEALNEKKQFKVIYNFFLKLSQGEEVKNIINEFVLEVINNEKELDFSLNEEENISLFNLCEEDLMNMIKYFISSIEGELLEYVKNLIDNEL